MLSILLKIFEQYTFCAKLHTKKAKIDASALSD